MPLHPFRTMFSRTCHSTSCSFAYRLRNPSSKHSAKKVWSWFRIVTQVLLVFVDVGFAALFYWYYGCYVSPNVEKDRLDRVPSNSLQERHMVIPYFHSVSTNLRAIINNYTVKGVSKNDFRVLTLAPFRGCGKDVCPIWYESLLVDRCVYDIPAPLHWPKRPLPSLVMRRVPILYMIWLIVEISCRKVKKCIYGMFGILRSCPSFS